MSSIDSDEKLTSKTRCHSRTAVSTDFFQGSKIFVLSGSQPD